MLFANPAVKGADPVEALVGLLGKWGRLGLTTASELALGSLSQSPADWQAILAAAQSGPLKARIRAWPFYTPGLEAWDQAGVKPGDGNALARIAGYELVTDGSNQGFTGLQREPYLSSGDRGFAHMSVDEPKARAVDCARRGWQLAIHANGDAGIDNALAALQAVADAGVDLRRLRAQRRAGGRRLLAARRRHGDRPAPAAHDPDGGHAPQLAGPGLRARAGRARVGRIGDPRRDG